MRHEPLLYRAARHGCWSSCLCGWRSAGRWTTLSGAHGEFGRHLVEETRRDG